MKCLMWSTYSGRSKKPSWREPLHRLSQARPPRLGGTHLAQANRKQVRFNPVLVVLNRDCSSTPVALPPSRNSARHARVRSDRTELPQCGLVPLSEVGSIHDHRRRRRLIRNGSPSSASVLSGHNSQPSKMPCVVGLA
jgi:hypothetical protein